jgi:hypothetical protein
MGQVGGKPVDNYSDYITTLLPYLGRWDFPEFQASWDFKIGPSVAIKPKQQANINTVNVLQLHKERDMTDTSHCIQELLWNNTDKLNNLGFKDWRERTFILKEKFTSTVSFYISKFTGYS